VPPPRRRRLSSGVKQLATKFLARAGFRTRTAITILKNWDVDDEVLTALETEENA
jgi:hypothetical protein